MNKKTPKTIRDIIDSNLEKNNEILLLVFCMSIPDTTGHQKAIQIPSLLNVCFCIT